MTMKRRAFMGDTLAATAALALGGRAQEAKPAAGAGALRLGGPSFAKDGDPEEFAKAHRKLGYRAAYCPKVPLTDADRIRALTEALARHDVVPAEVGRWCNLLDPDAEKRKQNLANVTDGLALAEAFGARCCVDIAGSFNKDSWFGPHPENLSPAFFDAAVENARKIIDAVKPRRAKFCYEMMAWSLPDSPDSYVAMIKAVDRDAFGVHLDPCNLVNGPARYYRMTDLLNECFDKLGPHIASCHAKDLAWDVEMSIHFREVAPGRGALDYATYLRRLAALPQGPPLMIEHLQGAEAYAEAAAHIVATGRKAGLRFE